MIAITQSQKWHLHNICLSKYQHYSRVIKIIFKKKSTGSFCSLLFAWKMTFIQMLFIFFQCPDCLSRTSCVLLLTLSQNITFCRLCLWIVIFPSEMLQSTSRMWHEKNPVRYKLLLDQIKLHSWKVSNPSDITNSPYPSSPGQQPRPLTLIVCLLRFSLSSPASLPASSFSMAPSFYSTLKRPTWNCLLFVPVLHCLSPQLISVILHLS